MLRLPWASVRALGSIATHSPDFPIMRAGRAALVDKTSAIADLLNFADPGDAHRIFFARPRKFGKSLTLSIAAEMLAAGPLPSGAVRWPGHEKVKIKELFGGLEVHERLLRKDATLRDLLKRPHFVIHLGLGGTQSGSTLNDSIILRIAAVARRAFGSAFGAQIAAMKEPADALDTLIEAVPSAFPIALLVDEYDAAVVQDASEGNWKAAKAGVLALRSLTMSTKASGTGSRIKRCIFTGVAHFVHTSLFSGAKNFTDVTGHPLLSRVLGFSEAEIRATFPTELQRLADSEGTDVDGAVRKLAHWYNGYCFDGDTTSFNPYPVLCALKAGKVTEKELDAASGVNWLGLTPRDLSEKLVDELVKKDTPVNYSSIDIASLELQGVRAVPLLLQVGLLSLQPGQKMGQQPQCRPPNEFARKSLQIMAANALSLSSSTLPGMNAALLACDHGAFTAAAQLVLTQIPNTIFKRNTDHTPGKLREDVFHVGLITAIFSSAPSGVRIIPQSASQVGLADIVVDFCGGGREVVWIIDLGVEGTATDKLAQVKLYAAAYGPSIEVLCCAVVVVKRKPASLSAKNGSGKGGQRRNEGGEDGLGGNGEESGEEEERIIDMAWAKRTVSSSGQVGWDKMEGVGGGGGG